MKGTEIMKKQTYTIKWQVNKYRKDKRVGAISPIKPGRYAQYLFEKGAGFNDKLGR